MSALPLDLARQALCRGKGPYPWITPEGMRKEDFEKAHKEAAVICNQCPVQFQCRAAGISEPRGTWGGVTFRERGYKE